MASGPCRRTRPQPGHGEETPMCMTTSMALVSAPPPGFGLREARTRRARRSRGRPLRSKRKRSSRRGRSRVPLLLVLLLARSRAALVGHRLRSQGRWECPLLLPLRRRSRQLRKRRRSQSRRRRRRSLERKRRRSQSRRRKRSLRRRRRRSQSSRKRSQRRRRSAGRSHASRAMCLSTCRRSSRTSRWCSRSRSPTPRPPASSCRWSGLPRTQQSTRTIWRNGG
mmetsp:Transcript_21292/g.50489  ORF Transcript_21292/g.50489 Transcript_21292/m.50489 type:complete len:224 (+) Transcript_21292:243-914(+)